MFICESSRTSIHVVPLVPDLVLCTQRTRTFHKCLQAHSLSLPLCWLLGPGPRGVCSKGPIVWRIFPIGMAICSFQAMHASQSCSGPTLTVRRSGQELICPYEGQSTWGQRYREQKGGSCIWTKIMSMLGVLLLNSALYAGGWPDHLIRTTPQVPPRTLGVMRES